MDRTGGGWEKTLRRELRREDQGLGRDARARWIEEHRERLLAAAKEKRIGSRAQDFAQSVVETAIKNGELPCDEAIAAAFAAYAPRAQFRERELGQLIPALRRELARAALSQDADAEVRALCAQGLVRLETAQALDARLQELGCLHGLLSQDEVYRHMTRESRAACRGELARLAKRYNIREEEAAQEVLRLSGGGRTPRERQVCYYIWERPMGKRRSVLPAFWYRLSLALLPLLLTLLLWPVCGLWMLASCPGWLALVHQLSTRAALRLMRPTYIPRMEKAARRTLCASVVLLTDEAQIEGIGQQLEEAYLAGVSPEERPLLQLAILADLPDAPQEQLPEDEALLRTACDVVQRLNGRWGEHFSLLVRKRSYNHSQGCWMGHERKRGAVMEALSLLRGRNSALQAAVGDLDALRTCECLVVLDADTKVNAGSLSMLMRAASHPLNRPECSPDGKRVERGYGILQPRLETEPESLQKSGFSRLFGGIGGFSTYSGPVSELSERLWGSANFTGKGLIDVPAADTVLSGCFADNTVLSHDYPEGVLLRTGIVGQASFGDGFPGGSVAWYKRQHRWVRGDTQNLRITGRLPAYARGHLWGLLGQNLWPAYVLLLILSALWIGRIRTAALYALLPVVLVLLLPLAGTRARRCLSPVSVGSLTAVGREVTRFILLPLTAWVQTSAVFTALWRMLVTHRGLLTWVTAGQAERGKRTGFWGNCRRMLPCILSAGAAFLSGTAAGWFLGLAWLAAPALLWRLDQRPARENVLSGQQKEHLRAQAGQMLGYYLDHMTAQSRFLPPDNVQEQPGSKSAPRTSPTNIGLAMLSLQAGAELGLVEQARVYRILEGCVQTLEELDKWRGQLYNWYELPSGRVLEPQVVSTVDCGNLAVCLVSLEQALERTGDARAETLAGRIRALRLAMDFAPFYDERRGLFHLGWDVPQDTPVPGHYDLMAGEHRLASYYAVAMGQVPPEHWRRLSRRMAGAYGYTGLVSWSGTCFEYLLPQLFLPRIPGTLWDETARFCALCQRRWAQDHRMPYGVSESAYFAFDETLDYQYKAHGVPEMGLARGLGKEAVASPYAAYLLLTVSPQDAMEALERFETRDMEGRYGLYEALDTTRRRFSSGSTGMPVRCHMAHHIGMSILSVHYALTGGGTVKDFLGDAQMRAFVSLLRERIPVRGKPMRTPGAGMGLAGYYDEPGGYLCCTAEYDAFTPFGTLLGNGAYRLYLTDTGLSWAVFRRRRLYRWDVDPLGTCTGMQFFLCDDRDRLVSLQPAPLYDDTVRYSSRLSGCSSTIDAAAGGWQTRLTARVSLSEPGEVRCVRLTNENHELRRVSLRLCLTPELCIPGEECAEPPQPRVDGRALHLRRVSQGEILYACLLCGQACAYTVDAGGETSAEVTLHIPAGQTQEVRFAMACGECEEEAYRAAQRCLELEDSGASRRMDETAAFLQLDHEAVTQAWALYTGLCFVTPAFRTNAAYLQKNRLGQAVLDRYGLARDLPLLVLRLPQELSAARACMENVLRRWLFLYVNGGFAELMVITRDGENFERPQQRMAARLLEDWNAASLVDCRGGIRLLEEGRLSEEERDSLMAQAAVCLDGTAYVPPRRQYRRLAHPVAGQRRVGERLPDCVLGNARIACAFDAQGCTGCALPHARQMLIVPGSMRVELVGGGGIQSVFPGTGENSGGTHAGWCGWDFSPGEGKLRTTAFVHPELSACILLFEGEELAADACLRISARLLLGRDAGDERTVLSWRDSGTGALCARNPGAVYLGETAVPYIAALCCHPQPTAWTCDRQSLAQGLYDESMGAGVSPCFAVEIPLKRDDSGGAQAVAVLGSVGQETELAGIAQLASLTRARELLGKRRVRGDGLTASAQSAPPATPHEALLEAAARMNENTSENEKDGSC